LNGVDVFLGVPTKKDLLKIFPTGHPGAQGIRRVLVLNAYEDFLRRPVFESLTRAGYVPCPVGSVAAAVRVLRTQAFAGVVVALSPVVKAEGEMVRSGIGLWAEVLARVADPAWAARPILVTATSRASASLVRAELERHAVLNPVLIATEADITEPAFSSTLRRHLGGND
jgi:hypothetical protein